MVFPTRRRRRPFCVGLLVGVAAVGSHPHPGHASRAKAQIPAWDGRRRRLVRRVLLGGAVWGRLVLWGRVAVAGGRLASVESMAYIFGAGFRSSHKLLSGGVLQCPGGSAPSRQGGRGSGSPSWQQQRRWCRFGWFLSSSDLIFAMWLGSFFLSATLPAAYPLPSVPYGVCVAASMCVLRRDVGCDPWLART